MNNEYDPLSYGDAESYEEKDPKEQLLEYKRYVEWGNSAQDRRKEQFIKDIKSQLSEIVEGEERLLKDKEIAITLVKEWGWKRYRLPKCDNIDFFVSPYVPSFEDFLSRLDIEDYYLSCELLLAYKLYIFNTHYEYVLDVS